MHLRTPDPRTGGRAFPALVVSGFTLAAVGLWVWAFVEGDRHWNDLAFLVWGVLVAALGAASGAVFTFGVSTAASIDLGQGGRWRPLGLRASGAALVAAALTSGNLAVDGSTGTLRGVGLTTLAIVGGTPSVVAMLGIRTAVARDRSAVQDTARQLRAYLRFRALAGELLAALGALVALTTFALAASIAAYGTWQGVPTAQVILVFGAFGTTLVAMGYQLPRRALRCEARQLLDELAPLAASSAAELCEELDTREKIERSLGLQTALLTELQAGIVIVSPLLAAATTLLFPGT